MRTATEEKGWRKPALSNVLRQQSAIMTTAHNFQRLPLSPALIPFRAQCIHPLRLARRISLITPRPLNHRSGIRGLQPGRLSFLCAQDYASSSVALDLRLAPNDVEVTRQSSCSIVRQKGLRLNGAIRFEGLALHYGLGI